MADVNSLPKEILSLVLSFLSANTKIVARLACTEWFKLIRHAHFELNLIRDDQWPLIASRLSQYDMPISIAFSSQPERRLENLMGPLTTLTNLESLTLGAIDRKCKPDDWFKLTCLTNLTYLLFHSRQPEPEFFSTMTWLRNFTASDAFASNTAHLISTWTSLEELAFEPDEEDDDAFALVKDNSRLTHLSLHYESCQYANEENTKALSNLKYLSFDAGNPVEISLRYMTALESLETSIPFHSLASSRLTFLRVFGVGAAKSAAVYATKMCNLNALEMSVRPENENFCKSLLTPLTVLETLTLKFGASDEDFDVLHNSLATTRLTDLRLHGWKMTEPIRITSLNSLSLFRLTEADYGSLTLLVNLTYLSVTPVDGQPLLPSLTSIKYLELSSFRMETGFHEMTNLEHLDMDVCAVHDLNGLQNATRLTKLELRSIRNQIADFGFLKTCTLLKEICISNLIGQNFWQNVSGLTCLRILQFPRMEREETVQMLTAMQNLRHLDTMAQNIHGKYLTLLTSLQTLNFLSNAAANYISTERLYSSLTRLASHRFK